DAPPEPADAAIVARLQGSGAVVVGLTAPHEFAFGVTGVNAHTGTPPNPADPGRIPGGSSSGSAVAVAEGSADLAVGTDTGGSVRIPAAFCGVVGFKPAYGGYPTEGVFPLSPTLDHVGLLATSVDAVRRVHAALGHDPGRGRLPERLGVAEPELEDADVVVAGRIEGVVRVLAAAGLALTRVTWPDQEEVSAVSTAVMYAEAAAVHRRDLDAHADRYGEDVRNRLLTGLQIPAAVYATALRARRGLERRVQAVLSDVDAVVGPTVGMVAPKQAAAGDPRLPGRIVRNTRLANVSRVPAISLPVPGDSLPVGLQLSAGDDARTLGYCAAVQALLQR
ncbi:MAG TPA: amidase, partial [Nitriliruptorales bacterium]|nr:amidase [Nitriliruptorales bacterium]